MRVVGFDMNFLGVQSKEADRWLTLEHIRVQQLTNLSRAACQSMGEPNISWKSHRRERCTCDLLDSIPRWNPTCIEFFTLIAMMLFISYAQIAGFRK